MVLIYLLFVLSILMLFCWRDTRKPEGFPPGPNWLPLVGILPLLMQLRKLYRFHHLIWQHLNQKYGAIVGLRLGKDRLIVVSGKEAIREFYSRPEFDGRPNGFFYRIRSFNQRLGLVFVDGNFWDAQRRFTVKTLKQLGMGKHGMVEHMENEAVQLMQFFREKSKSGQPIDLHNAFDIPVLNLIWALLAGQRFNLDDKRLDMLMKHIHESFRIIDMSGGILNQFPAVRHIIPDLSGFRPFIKVFTPLWRFLGEVISQIKERDSVNEPTSLIEAYLQELRKTNTKLDPSSSFSELQLLCLCLDMFEAGSETTSNTLGFAMIYMLHNSQVQKKVKAELDVIVGRHRLPTLNDRPKLRFTEAVICEILRFANVAPLALIHRAMESVKFCGYIIPENTLALVSLYSLHMDETYWGDPHVFRPERFLNAEGRIIQHECFLPFGLGKRRCMGENLAKSSLFLFFASFLHSFDIALPPGDQMPELDGNDGITLSPKPYRVILTSRD